MVFYLHDSVEANETHDGNEEPKPAIWILVEGSPSVSVDVAEEYTPRGPGDTTVDPGDAHTLVNAWFTHTAPDEMPNHQSHVSTGMINPRHQRKAVTRAEA